MAAIEREVKDKINNAVCTVSSFVPVSEVYLFGSHVAGRQNEFSDIDVAVFAQGVEDWDIYKKARVSATVQREAGDDVEIHLFSSLLLNHRDPAGFAAWVIKNGIKIKP